MEMVQPLSHTSGRLGSPGVASASLSTSRTVKVSGSPAAGPVEAPGSTPSLQGSHKAGPQEPTLLVQLVL